mmetsp:Transcript_16777/g.42215  ORF Transcript_16777/g.42215 Transcript_16777/m.42215 type:complete len:218 (-) Transcript_16777:14-667(-)
MCTKSCRFASRGMRGKHSFGDAFLASASHCAVSRKPLPSNHAARPKAATANVMRDADAAMDTVAPEVKTSLFVLLVLFTWMLWAPPSPAPELEGHCFLRSSADIGNFTPKVLPATKTFLHSSAFPSSYRQSKIPFCAHTFALRASTSCVAMYSVTNVSRGPQSCWQFLKQTGARSVTMLRMPLAPAQTGSPAEACAERDSTSSRATDKTAIVICGTF